MVIAALTLRTYSLRVRTIQDALGKAVYTFSHESSSTGWPRLDPLRSLKLRRLRNFVLVLFAAFVLTLAAGSAKAQGALGVEQVLFDPTGGGAGLFGASVDMSNDGTVGIVGAPGTAGESGGNEGKVFIFRRGDGPWDLVTSLVSPGASAGDLEGAAVRITPDGNLAVVGVPGAVGGGKVLLFGFNSESWNLLQVLRRSGQSSGDRFGEQVEISADGSHLAVSSPLDSVGGNDLQGSVTVFDKVGSAWTEQGTLLHPSGAADDYFGSRIALSGDSSTLAVAARSDVDGRMDQGSVTIFSRASGTWELDQVVFQPDPSSFDLFGSSLDLTNTGNFLAVGSPLDEEPGQAYGTGKVTIFSKSSNWVNSQTLKDPTPQQGDEFGGGALEFAGAGRVLAVGHPWSRSGAEVLIFRLEGDSWTSSGSFDSSGGSLGGSVALSADGTRAFVSAQGYVGGRTSQGIVKAFARIPTAIWSGIPSTSDIRMPIDYKLTFSEPISGLTSSDFTNLAGARDCVFDPESSSGTVIAVSVSNCSHEGALAPRLAPLSVRNADGSPGPSAALTAPTVVVDLVSPRIEWFPWNWSGEPATNATTLVIPIGANEGLSDIQATDFVLSGSAAGCSARPDADIPTQIFVFGCGEGTLRIKMLANSLSDVAGNRAPSSDLLSSQVIIDRTAPSQRPTITAAIGADGSRDPSFAFAGATDGEGYECKIDSGEWDPCSSLFAPRGLSLGRHSLSVRIVDLAGNSGPEISSSFSFGAPAPPEGPVGVSINNGDSYTNSPDVYLSPIWPLGARGMTISNDGGFAAGQTRGLAESVPWRLDEQSPERIPKTVYVHFLDTNGSEIGGLRTDDIILDTRTPQIRNVSAKRISNTRIALNVAAVDAISGVSKLEFSSKRAGSTKQLPFAKRISVATPLDRFFIRVVDRAGNRSGWQSVAVN